MTITGTSLRSELASELRKTAGLLPRSSFPSNNKSNSTSERGVDPAIISSSAQLLLDWVLSRPALLADHAADVELAFRTEMQSKVIDFQHCYIPAYPHP